MVLRCSVAASIALACALAACGTGLPVATAGDAARAGIELAELQRGRSLVAAKCGNCHRPPAPDEHRTSDWPHMLDEMAARSHLDDAQQHLIEQYLVTMAHR
jgi:nitrate/TMAO reductase-like tetraheme cytochrome c subunit